MESPSSKLADRRQIVLDAYHHVTLGGENIGEEGVFVVVDGIAVIEEESDARLDAKQPFLQLGAPAEGELDRNVGAA